MSFLPLRWFGRDVSGVGNNVYLFVVDYYIRRTDHRVVIVYVRRTDHHVVVVVVCAYVRRTDLRVNFEYEYQLLA